MVYIQRNVKYLNIDSNFLTGRRRLSVRINVIAYTVPAICIVLGFLLILGGETGDKSSLTNTGYLLIVMGFILQVLWLRRRRW